MGEHDVAGCITGVVEKNKIITGQNIRPGDIILGFVSKGLHTNGYSLARKLFFEVGGYTADFFMPELGKTIGAALLETHLSYLKPVMNIIRQNVTIKGIAHITGGGFIDNIPRILPPDCDAAIHLGRWPVAHLPDYANFRRP